MRETVVLVSQLVERLRYFLFDMASYSYTLPSSASYLRGATIVLLYRVAWPLSFGGAYAATALLQLLR